MLHNTTMLIRSAGADLAGLILHQESPGLNRRNLLWSGRAAVALGLVSLCGCDYSSTESLTPTADLGANFASAHFRAKRADVAGQVRQGFAVHGGTNRDPGKLGNAHPAAPRFSREARISSWRSRN